MIKRSISMMTALLILVAVLSTGVGSLTASASTDGWVGSWSTSPVKSTVSPGSSAKFSDWIPARSTLRSVIRLTTGGSQVRFKFSNKYGSSDIVIGEASVAKTDTSDPAVNNKIIFETSRGLTFNGQTTCVVPAGSYVWSDPVRMSVSALEKLSVSTYFPYVTLMSTSGLCGAMTYMSTGTASQVNDEQLYGPAVVNIASNTIKYDTIPFLINCDVYAPGKNAVVVIGDSTLANDIPEMLARRLAASGIKDWGVLQQAIVGNRLLDEGVGLLGDLYGERMVNRFDDDCLQQSGAKICIIKIGLNDLLHPICKSMVGKATPVSDQQILDAYTDLARRAKAKGMDVYFYTKTPVKGYVRDFILSGNDIEWDDKTIKQIHDRIEVLDKWVMTTDEIDGWFEIFNVRDAYDTDRFVPIFSDDWVHPTKLCQIVMTDAIPLSIFDSKMTKEVSAASVYKVDPFSTIPVVAQRGVPSIVIPGQTDVAVSSTRKVVQTPSPKPAIPTTAPTEAPATAAPEPVTQPEPANTTAAGQTPGYTYPAVTTAPAPITQATAATSYTVYTYAVIIAGDGTTATETQTATAVMNADGQIIATQPAGTTPAGEPVMTVPNEELTPIDPVDTSMSTGTKAGILIAVLLTVGVAIFAGVMIRRRNKELILGA